MFKVVLLGLDNLLMLKKIFLTIFLIIFAVALVGLAVVVLKPSEKVVLFDKPTETPEFSENPQNKNLIETPAPSQSENISSGVPQNSITLMFVGDIMLSRQVGSRMEKENNWQWPFLKIADSLKEADILFGNLEGPISDKGKNLGSIYSFRTDPRAVEGLNFAGFDVLSLANNHMFDWGRDALEDTFKKLKEAGISYAGGGMNENEAYASIIKEIRGLKITFLAYCSEGSTYWAATADKSGIAWFKEERLKKDIAQAKTLADLVVVSMHFGEEYQQKPNAVQKSFARLAIDSGADLVVGHHPHVLQSIEEYKQGFIAYSLGNFIFDQNFSPQTRESMILKIIVETPSTDSGQVAKIKIVMPLKAEISNDFQVFLK